MFENDIFDFDFLNDILDWDKKSYRFNRDEKDMHPYSVHKTDKLYLITHNILGINKEDITLKVENENGVSYILIEGKTKDTMKRN